MSNLPNNANRFTVNAIAEMTAQQREEERHDVAVQAMAAVLSREGTLYGEESDRELASAAYDVAEAMILERERRAEADSERAELGAGMTEYLAFMRTGVDEPIPYRPATNPPPAWTGHDELEQASTSEDAGLAAPGGGS